MLSVERDEWMIDHDNSLSGLFMPFANLHTQVQEILTDFPSYNAIATHDAMNWPVAAQATAGEYAHYMLTHMIDAWKNQMCRSVRLRYSPSTSRIYWQYMLVVLKPIWQPHAGQDCFDQCGSKSGWCNYCGGRNRGACCKAGAAQENPPQDPSECLQFDPPVGYEGTFTSYNSHTSHVCMHSDCEQQDLYYKGGIKLHEWENVTSWETCQAECLLLKKSANTNLSNVPMIFTWSPHRTVKCKCRAKVASTVRIYMKDAVSGPVPCPGQSQEEDAPTEEAKAETPKVPMMESAPCSGSQWVTNLEALQNNHEENETHNPWIHDCYQNVSKSVAATEFNPFYTRFAQFVDRLAWRAGCGPHPELTENEDFGAIGEQEFGSFGDCDWERVKKTGENPEWTPDEERAKAWFGHSKISLDEQAQLRRKYPLPMWLETRRGMLECLAQASKGGAVTDEERAVVGLMKNTAESINES